MIGYRKHGHNELDQPSFTQPFMYQQIAKMTPVARIYENQLKEEGVVDDSKIDAMKKNIQARLEEGYVKSKQLQYKAEDWKTEEWQKIKSANLKEAQVSGIPVDRIREIGSLITVLPEGGQFHRLVAKIFEAR